MCTPAGTAGRMCPRAGDGSGQSRKGNVMALIPTTSPTTHPRLRLDAVGRVAAGLLLVAFVASACSSNGSSSTTTSSGSTGTTGSTSATTTSSALTVAAKAVSKVGTVLVGPSGDTLYHDDADSQTHIACTGGCAQAWPPLTVSSGQRPELASGVPGTVGTVKRPDGTTQVTYNGLPLYYYSGDSSPGQANGQGLGGVWFVIKPSAGVAGGSSSSTTTSTAQSTTTTAGGYSY